MLKQILIALSCMVASAGCNSHGQSDTALSSAPLATAQSGTGSGELREYFIFVAEGLPREQQLESRDAIKQILVETQEGEVVHVVTAPTHERIASVTIAGKSLRTRMRSKAFAQSAKLIDRFLKADTDAGSLSTPGQLDIPRIPTTVAQLRQTSFRPVILAIGDPVYRPSIDEDAWAMTGSCVISDHSLTSAQCPFGPATQVELPSEGGLAEVYFVSSETSWADSPIHQTGIVRFYQLYFSQSRATFWGVYSDPFVVIEKFNARDNDLPTAPTVIDDSFIGMWNTRTPYYRQVFSPAAVEVPVDDMPKTSITRLEDDAWGDSSVALSFITESEERYFRDLPSDKMAIWIRWYRLDEGPQDTDLDLWIADRQYPADEINYSRMRTTWGSLFRDIRHVLNDATADETQCEYVEIFHDRLADLDAWVNCYQASGNYQCVIRCAWKGVVRAKTIGVKVEQGDFARGQFSRADNDAWIRIDLAKMFENPHN